MSLPTGHTDLSGCLVLSGSTELNIPVGISVATGDSLTSNNIDVGGEATAILLLQLTSGTYTVVADVAASGTPTFASANKVTVTNVTAGLPVFVEINTSAALPIVAFKVTNNSGSTLGVVKSACTILARYPDSYRIDNFLGVKSGFVIKDSDRVYKASSGATAYDPTIDLTDAPLA